MPKLTKFKEKEGNNNLRNYIISAIILVGALLSFFIYKSYAAYKVEKKYDVIKARIGEFGMPNGAEFSAENTLNVTENGTYVGFIKDTQGNVKTCSVKVDKIEDVKPSGILMAADDSQAFWQYKANISKIVFENELIPKENAAYTFDVSEKQDGSVMSYVVANEDDSSTYTTYIQAKGKIIASSCFNLFYNFTKLISIDGLENFDTSNITSMFAMFGNCQNLINLDVSHFDTSNVTDMRNMFTRCSNLIKIEGLENFDTQNVTSMSSMFSWCNALKELNVSGFNTSNVTGMQTMFGGCSSLTSLDVSNFDMRKINVMDQMFAGCSNLRELNAKNLKIQGQAQSVFYGCSSLTNLDLSNADISSLQYRVFTNMPSSTIVKVKDAYIQTQILNLSSSDRPASWTTANVIVAS